ncbi:MAG: sugar ABC transporter ATP-binding protein [Clostridia bacterium]|nr:sugar ABC transporter ATP-binding protein [Clostridia bacterium]
MAELLLKMEGIEKHFPGVHALNNCRFELYSGEVHALVGENGAGKSTLMKVLNGIYKRDAGTIVYRGQPVELSSPLDAKHHGIGMIHQELNLMPDLTVAENIFIGKEFTRSIFLDRGQANRETKKLLNSLNLDISPTTQVKKLSVAKQQMVEIAKALSDNSELFVMDEPTAALTEAEISELFRFIRELKAAGKGVIYISHRLEELWQISDRITVMRDGQYIATSDTDKITRQEVVTLMVNRVITEERKHKSLVDSGAPVVLEAKGLTAPGVKDVSFTLRRGEVLGFAGLMGAGRTETMRALFGADVAVRGELFLHGKKITIKNPGDAVSHGIGYLSEDRKAFGLAIGLSVRDNVVMAAIEEFTRGVFMDDAKADRTAREYIDLLSIKTPSTSQLVRNLSGGNQQKIVLAKWLIRNCDILIFDEPTRGIDVGAKSEIYQLMRQLADSGKSIVMISSEMPELLRMADRIVVMCEGVVTGELDIADATQEKIMTLATWTMK